MPELSEQQQVDLLAAAELVGVVVLFLSAGPDSEWERGQLGLVTDAALSEAGVAVRVVFRTRGSYFPTRRWFVPSCVDVAEVAPCPKCEEVPGRDGCRECEWLGVVHYHESGGGTP